MIVTIDGPAGSGKSTAARGLAKRLGFDYLDTGAMYRAVGLLLTRAGLSFNDETRVVDLLNQTILDMPAGKILLDSEDVTEAIRVPAMSDAASRVAAEPHVRAILVGWQRRIAAGRQMVCEGRDQGSVVFSDSPCKFYLTASAATRAARRYAELLAKGVETTHQKVMEDIEIRDHRDRNREVAPLRMPHNAILIETDYLNPTEVIDRLEAEVNKCRHG